MSVHLDPDDALGFNRPFTRPMEQDLWVSNWNSSPVAFKIKTTAPELFCARPNSGRIEPGCQVKVSVMLQPMKKEPPLSAKSKDRFQVLSTLITPDRATTGLEDIWNVPSDASEEWQVHRKQMRVAYLPPKDALQTETIGRVPPPLPPSRSSKPAQPVPRAREPDDLSSDDSNSSELIPLRSTSDTCAAINDHQSPPPSPPPPPPPPPVIQINHKPGPSPTAPELAPLIPITPSESQRTYGTIPDNEEVGTARGAPLRVAIVIALGVLTILVALGVFLATYLFS